MTIAKRYHILPIDLAATGTPQSIQGGVLPEVLHQRLRLAHAQLRFRSTPANGQSTLLIPSAQTVSAFSKHTIKLTSAASPGTTVLPGLEVIGCGYDVFGMEADSSSLKRPILDPAKTSLTNTLKVGEKQYSHYAISTANAISTFRQDVVSGMTLRSYSDALSVRAGISGSYAGFSAQTELDVSQSSNTNWYSAFTNIYDTMTLWNIMLNDGNLRAYATTEAIDAIDNWDAARLFDEYGMYFLVGAVIGGRVNYFSTTDMFSYSESTSVEAVAKASYLGLIGASTSIATAAMVAEFNQHSTTTLTTIGGNPSLGAMVLNDSQSYANFMQSINSAPGFVDFTRVTTKRPLRPIWDLAASASRKQELAIASRAYAESIMSSYSGMYSASDGPRAVTLLISTKTRDVKGAGTDSGISFKINGVNHLGQTTQTVELRHDDGADNHERNRLDSIAYQGITDIGTPTMLDVLHDGKGDNSPWCVDYIKVAIPAKGRSYICRPDPTWFDGGGWRRFQLLRE